MSAGLPALDDAGEIVPESAQQFNRHRSGQNALRAYLPAAEAAASASFSALVAFARDHDLRLFCIFPGVGDINLDDPGPLPPFWKEEMT